MKFNAILYPFRFPSCLYSPCYSMDMHLFVKMYHAKFCSIPSHPFPSYPILSYPIPSHPILSYPIPSHPILSYPTISYLILSYLIICYHIPHLILRQLFDDFTLYLERSTSCFNKIKRIPSSLILTNAILLYPFQLFVKIQHIKFWIG